MKFLLKTPDGKRKILVFFGDAVLMAVTLFVIVLLYDFIRAQNIAKILNRPLRTYVLYLSAVIYLLMFYIFEMYEVQRKYDKLSIFAWILLTSLLSFCFIFGLAKVLRINKVSMIYAFVFFVASAFVLYYWRLAFRVILIKTRHLIKQRVLFVGSDPITSGILSHMKHRDYKVVGLTTEDASDNCRQAADLEVVGTAENLSELIVTYNVNTLITALSQSLPLSVMKQIYKCKFRGVEVYDSAFFYEMLARKVPLGHYLANNRIPYFNIDAFAQPTFKNLKRLIDLVGAGVGLAVLLPVFIAIIILNKLTSKGPVFFLQERVGFQERPFRLIKFRTMVEDAESKTGPQWASKEDPRVTKVGKFLRKTRLDELPQLINVLKGDISFVGPRPIRKCFADIIEEKLPFYSLRFTVKPGLTGWAQAHYDYGGTIEGHIEKFQYDLYYLKHVSLLLDLFILLKTIQTLIRKPAY